MWRHVLFVKTTINNGGCPLSYYTLNIYYDLNIAHVIFSVETYTMWRHVLFVKTTINNGGCPLSSLLQCEVNGNINKPECIVNVH